LGVLGYIAPRIEAYAVFAVYLFHLPLRGDHTVRVLGAELDNHLPFCPSRFGVDEAADSLGHEVLLNDLGAAVGAWLRAGVLVSGLVYGESVVAAEAAVRVFH